MEDINPDTLAKFDGLVLYANIDRIEDVQGEGVVGLRRQRQRVHSAALCDVLLAKQSGHRRADGSAVSAAWGSGLYNADRRCRSSDHERLWELFTSWDETYIHHCTTRKIARFSSTVSKASRRKETRVSPGRGFGLTERGGCSTRHGATISEPFPILAFTILVERGIRWACGDDPSRKFRPSAIRIGLSRLPA